MKKPLLAAVAAAALALPLSAQDEPQSRSNSEALAQRETPRSNGEALAQTETPPPSPNQIVEAAPTSDWVAIAPEDLLVMTLAPDAQGNPREVVIQLMPAPFSQGWVSNIRTLARAKWYDNISVNRVQDNYVVQWGDPNYDNPEASGEAKPLPEGLKVMGEDEYLAQYEITYRMPRSRPTEVEMSPSFVKVSGKDPYGDTAFSLGWPVGLIKGRSRRGNRILNPERGQLYPTHCYGMVGVGRNYSPDTGSGAELYAVIGHAPRHLDHNIALVGRVIEGMEHLSSLPRGKGDLSFYADFEKDKRTPILTVRIASDLPASSGGTEDGSRGQPVGRKYAFEYLSTDSASFAKYAEARANRRDPFFIHPAGGADICNIPVPVRRVTSK